MNIKNLIVLSISGPHRSKINSYGYYKVVMKSTEKDDMESYTLNINLRPGSEPNFNAWISACKPGYVLKCVMQGRNPLNVDQTMEFAIISKPQSKNQEEIAQATGETPEQMVLALQLNDIEKNVKKILSTVNVIRKEYRI